MPRKDVIRTCYFTVLICSLIAFPSFAPDSNNQELPFKSGERLAYDIKFKWGIIMVRAGSASYSINDGKYNNKPALKTSLTFRTSSFFDKIFKVHDTLYSYSDINMIPLYHKKFLHEGNTNYTEELFYKQYGKSSTKARSIRYLENNQLKFDSLLVNSGYAIDMLGIFSFARMLDYNNLKSGDSFPLAIFVGRDVVKMKVHYAGQEILEKNETQKYKTLKFNADIVDETFESHKNAMEMWISDDPNHIPVKLKAKLKIGAAEAHLSSYKGTKYPLSSLVTIKK